MPSSSKTTICKNLKELWYEKNNKYKKPECIILNNIDINPILNDLEKILYTNINQNSIKNDDIEGLIIIDIDFNYINIIKILKITSKYKLNILVIETKLSEKFNKLLNFINVEKNNKNIIKKHEWKRYYVENNKINKLVNNLNYIKHIKIPITPIISKEFWYEYSY